MITFKNVLQSIPKTDAPDYIRCSTRAGMRREDFVYTQKVDLIKLFGDSVDVCCLGAVPNQPQRVLLMQMTFECDNERN